jgi:hypothetical protein
MMQHDLNDICYIGFHWGLCLLNKKDGAIPVKKSTRHNLYTHRPLCSILPGSNETKLTEKMLRWVCLI